MQIEFHPLADLFPLMDGAEFAALVEDIREHGLREPIVLHDGKILDGRNRYRACLEAGAKIITEEWDQDGTAQAFVVSKNLHRRHLNESQRAMIAAKIANRTREESLRPGGTAPSKLETQICVSTSIDEAAELLNVSPRSVQSAKRVLKDGTEEEIASVEAGASSVNTIERQISAKMPAKKRAKNRAEPMSQRGNNPERIQRQQIKAEVWGHVREALVHLTSLPLPSEVVAIVRASDRTGLVDAKLAPAIKWLKDFSDAWHDQSEAA